MNQQIQQNLNQIVSMCNQLSQSEQTNVSKLSQMLEAERTAAQQLQHCAQLCQQVSQQMQQMITQQYNNINTSHFAAATPGTYGAQSGITTSSWANRPVSTGNFSTGGQYGGSQFTGGMSHYGAGRFETARELTPTGASAFNTNKDLNS